MDKKKLSIRIVRSVLLVAILLAGFQSLQAATIVWTNTLGGSWSDPANWSPNSVPTYVDDAQILAEGAYDVSLDTSTDINSFEVGAGGESAPTFHTGTSTLNVNGPVLINGGGTIAVEGGSLTGPGTVTVHGAIGWSGGSLGNGGNIYIAPGGVMVLYSGNDALYGPMTNAGTIELNGGILRLLGACYNTAGMLVNQTNGLVFFLGDVSIQALCGDETFVNYGKVLKQGAIATSDIVAPFYNYGTVDVESGTISLDSTYSLTNGILNFGIINEFAYGTLALSGDPAQLAGTISATLTGDYQPIATNEFPVITYTSASGVFTNEALPYLDAWQVDYGQTAFSLIVLNARPMISRIRNQIIGEFSTLAVYAIATDADQPPQSLAFSLSNAPAGMTIDPKTGLVLWSPVQTQSPSTNYVTVVVTDNGSPSLSTNTTLTVVVLEQNVPPEWPSLGVETVNEDALLKVDMGVTEKNIHSKVTGYHLINPPLGVSISSNGLVTWTPGQNQSPSTNVITATVTNSDPLDLTTPILVATNQFTVIVFAPTLATIQNYSVTLGSTLTFKCAATDNDPTRQLTFSIVDGPSSASVGTTNGVFTWQPAPSDNGTSNNFTIQVTDDSVPPLTASQSFSVSVVTKPAAPPVEALGVSGGHFQFQVNGPLGKTYAIDATPSLPVPAWTNLQTFVPTNMPFIFTDTNSLQSERIYRVMLSP